MMLNGEKGLLLGRTSIAPGQVFETDDLKDFGPGDWEPLILKGRLSVVEGTGRMAVAPGPRPAARQLSKTSTVVTKPSEDVPSLDELTVPELREIATAKGIRGVSQLRKGDLVREIRAADAQGGGINMKTRWSLDPEDLEDVDLDDLNLMIAERTQESETFGPYDTVEECIAQLSMDFVG